VKGKLVHHFGQKESIFYTLYKRGVLVETVKNEEVRSFLPGKIVWVGPFRGYHNLVIMDHGKGSFSVYGNLDEIFAIVDEFIDQGTPLGTVAYNDQEQRYLFYFETRLNKRAVNPMPWLAEAVWR
jgi:septal ring factor EnvC (AmiA/AmiB activator)